MTLRLVLSGLLAFVGTVGLILLLSLAARRLSLIDVPDSRKHHAGETPLVGGIAIFGGMVIAGLAFDGFFSSHDELLIGLSLLLLTGVIDDRGGLTPRTRLLIQAGAALIMVLGGGIQLDNLGNLFGTGDIILGPWAVPFTVFAVVGVINALNMIDGVDGLAGGLAMIALGLFWIFSPAGGSSGAVLLLLLICAIAGFMFFNMRAPWRSRAAVFLGDAGSMMLGFALAWYAVDLASVRDVFPPITAVWILAIPLMDTVSQMTRRVLKGKSPFSADREHLHHILQRAGFSHGETAAIMWLISLLLAGIGIAGWRLGVPEYAMFYGFVMLFGLYFFGMMHAWKLMKLVRRAHDGVEVSPHELSAKRD